LEPAAPDLVVQVNGPGTVVAIGSDDVTELTSALAGALEGRGYRLARFGAVADGSTDWPSIARAVGAEVAAGRAAFGVVCCWTGTGVSIAANKIAGVRAALCADAATASGARRWNDANVLALSLRATSVSVGLEILDAFIAGVPSVDAPDRAAVEAIEPPVP
jgi:ribose 5-phosphate isomerase B